MPDTQKKIVELVCEMNNNGLRIGQIMSNVFDKIAEDSIDPFYVEDKKFLEYLIKYQEQ